MTTPRTAVALFGICVGLAACTTVFYEKHGAKTADVTQDFLECQEAARETRVDRVSSVARTINVVLRDIDIDPATFDRVTFSRGYTSSLPRD